MIPRRKMPVAPEEVESLTKQASDFDLETAWRHFAAKASRLCVFDFDDTLVSSVGSVGVVHEDGERIDMDSQTFAHYQVMPGDELDFGAFNDVINHRIIKPNMDRLRQVLKEDGVTVVILTARPRGSAPAVQKFLSDLGIEDVDVRALQSSDPYDKARWIEKAVESEGYKDLEFYDDSTRNASAVAESAHKFPSVKWESKPVPHPKETDYDGPTIKRHFKSDEPTVALTKIPKSKDDGGSSQKTKSDWWKNQTDAFRANYCRDHDQSRYCHTAAGKMNAYRKKEILERAQEMNNRKVLEAAKALIKKIDLAGPAAGIWLESLEGTFGDLEAKGEFKGFNRNDFQVLQGVLFKGKDKGKQATEDRVKYPRTPHLPGSPGATNDDRILTTTAHFEGMTVVVTEKMDGENCTIGKGYTHARSRDSGPHESRSWVKGLAAQVGLELPDGWRLCGENLFAQHSIPYDALPSYFTLFSVWDEHNNCLSWDDTEAVAQMLGIHTVPVLYKGPWNEKKIVAVFDGKSKYSLGGPAEGYVVRNAAGFAFSSFDRNIAKFVRSGHVQTGDHWMQKKVIPNKLMKTATKTKGEVEDEEVERLVRPAPKMKPPRMDLRRDLVKEHDPDVDGDKSDSTKDKDLSMNYKKVGMVSLKGLYAGIEAEASRIIMAKMKPLPKLPPIVKPPTSSKKPEHKPGDVWQSEDKETWSGKNLKGETQGGFKSEESAKAYVKGEKAEGKDKGPIRSKELQAIEAEFPDTPAGNWWKSYISSTPKADPDQIRKVIDGNIQYIKDNFGVTPDQVTELKVLGWKFQKQKMLDAEKAGGIEQPGWKDVDPEKEGGSKKKIEDKAPKDQESDPEPLAFSDEWFARQPPLTPEQDQQARDFFKDLPEMTPEEKQEAADWFANLPDPEDGKKEPEPEKGGPKPEAPVKEPDKTELPGPDTPAGQQLKRIRDTFAENPAKPEVAEETARESVARVRGKLKTPISPEQEEAYIQDVLDVARKKGEVSFPDEWKDYKPTMKSKGDKYYKPEEKKTPEEGKPEDKPPVEKQVDLDISEAGIPNKGGEDILRQEINKTISGEGLSKKDVDKAVKRLMKELRSGHLLDNYPRQQYFSAEDQQKLEKKIMDSAAKLHPEWATGGKAPATPAKKDEPKKPEAEKPAEVPPTDDSGKKDEAAPAVTDIPAVESPKNVKPEVWKKAQPLLEKDSLTDGDWEKALGPDWVEALTEMESQGLVKDEGGGKWTPLKKSPGAEVEDVEGHKNGEWWKAKDGTSWSAKNKEGESKGGFEEEESAKAFATGQASEDLGDPSEDFGEMELDDAKAETDKKKKKKRKPKILAPFFSNQMLDNEIPKEDLGEAVIKVMNEHLIPSRIGTEKPEEIQSLLEAAFDEQRKNEGIEVSTQDRDAYIKAIIEALPEEPSLPEDLRNKLNDGSTKFRDKNHVKGYIKNLFAKARSKGEYISSEDEKAQIEYLTQKAEFDPNIKVKTELPKVKGFEFSDKESTKEELVQQSSTAVDRFMKGTPEDRKLAASQLSEAYNAAKEGSAEEAQIEAALNGLRVAAALNDEEIELDESSDSYDEYDEMTGERKKRKSNKTGPIVPKVSPMGSGLFKALYRSGKVSKLFEGNSVFAGTSESRKELDDAMQTLSDFEIQEVVGGSNGPYKALIEAWNDVNTTAEQRIQIMDFIRVSAIDDMTILHELALASERKDEKKGNYKNLTKEIQSDPSVKAAMMEASQYLSKGSDREESQKVLDNVRLTKIGVLVKKMKEMGFEDAENPLLKQALDVLESGNLELLKVEYRMVIDDEKEPVAPPLRNPEGAGSSEVKQESPSTQDVKPPEGGKSLEPPKAKTLEMKRPKK